jgi:hypothetical protein
MMMAVIVVSPASSAALHRRSPQTITLRPNAPSHRTRIGCTRPGATPACHWLEDLSPPQTPSCEHVQARLAYDLPLPLSLDAHLATDLGEARLDATASGGFRPEPAWVV